MLSVPPHVGPSLAPSPVVSPAPLLPLHRPPPSSAPQHPARPPVAVPTGWIRTVHAAPAAWPRSYAESRGNNERSSHPYSPRPANESKEERAARIEREKVVCGEMPKNATEWGIDEALAAQADPLWVPVERWRREVPQEGGVTLILLHANGMPKEDYHPVLRRFLASSPATRAFGTGVPLPPTEILINDIFLLEDTMHGVGQDLNAGWLPSIHAWSDWARDVLNFVLHVLPGMPDDAPWQLGWSDSGTRRRVFGVGHSLGGNALVQASVTRPDAFEGLMLVDPMTQPTGANSSTKMGYPMQALTLKRRSTWPTLAEAAEANRANPMFSKFDPETFKVWLKFGLIPTVDGVTLATPTWAEACVFSDPRAPQRGWDLLPQLRVPVGFCMAEDTRWMGGPKLQRELVWRPPRARNEMVQGAGHLVVQEKPDETAAALGRFLATVLSGKWDEQRGKL